MPPPPPPPSSSSTPSSLAIAAIFVLFSVPHPSSAFGANIAVAPPLLLPPPASLSSSLLRVRIAGRGHRGGWTFSPSPTSSSRTDDTATSSRFMSRKAAATRGGVGGVGGGGDRRLGRVRLEASATPMLDVALGLSGGAGVGVGAAAGGLIAGIDVAASSLLVAFTESVSPALSSLFSWGGNVPMYQAFALNAVLFGILSSKLRNMLTPEGFAHSLALATLLWATLGWRGWSLCVLYLFLGQAVTKVKFEEKRRAGIAEGRGGRRGPENVWGSALTGLLCASASIQGDSFLGISSDLFVLAYVASLATKLADTFASEIGKAYGKTTFLITTLERVEPGTEGAISLEGTAAAVVGGFLLGLYGWAVQLIDGPGAVAVVSVAAFLATNAESLIGATLQGKDGLRWITNEVVNFLNTLIGAAIAIVAGRVFLAM